ncbi:MAG: chloride channel protein [Planctomycetota bacterium]
MDRQRPFRLAVAASLIGVAAGAAAAVFLWSLEHVTRLHWEHPELLFLLPLAGLLSGVVYARIGGLAEGGTELILREVRKPAAGVPGRMAPLVLAGTLVTHLCGGSAGREGTAVQMGASLAAVLARWLRVPSGDLPKLLTCGLAAGFAAVFGTPLAGAVFALEVSTGRPAGEHSGARVRRFVRLLTSLLLCLLAAVVAHETAKRLGVGHTHYRIAGFGDGHSSRGFLPASSSELVRFAAAAGVAGVAFGLSAGMFIILRNTIRALFRKHVSRVWMRPVIGGIAVVLLAVLTHDTSSLGLGVEASPQRPDNVCIRSCLEADPVGWLTWFRKLLFTAVTVGSGFKGGEVTPLFFVGAALGNFLSGHLAIPTGLLAAMGFVAVFAGAARTPLACSLMALEVFGSAHPELLSFSFLGPTALCCLVAARCSGPNSIYDSESPFPPSPLPGCRLSQHLS